MSLFHLDWHRDSRGYAFTEEPRGNHWVRTYPHSRHPWITRKGGRLDAYQPLAIPRLYEKLAEHDPTDDGAMALVQRFGFLLIDAAFASSECAGHVASAIGSLREMISVANRRDWDFLQFCLEDFEPVILARDLAFDLIAPTNGDRPILRLRPMSLLSAAVLQLMQDAAVGQRVRQCARPGCGKWFEYKRDTARYCSSKCKDAHKFQKRKETGHDQGIDHPPRKKVLAAKVRRRPRSGHK